MQSTVGSGFVYPSEYLRSVVATSSRAMAADKNMYGNFISLRNVLRYIL